MDPQLLIAQWSGKLPEGFVRPAGVQTGLAECKHKRCRNKVAIKRDGTPVHACQNCLGRRARSCKRRWPRWSPKAAAAGARNASASKATPSAQGAARTATARAQKRQDTIDAAAIDDFAAQPERVPQGEQYRPRRLALEREAEAAADCRLLVAVARSGAARRARVGEGHLGHRVAYRRH